MLQELTRDPWQLGAFAFQVRTTVTLSHGLARAVVLEPTLFITNVKEQETFVGEELRGQFILVQNT